MRSPWPTIALGEAGAWLSGGTPSKSDAALWSGPIPWVSPKDMKRSKIADAEDHVSAAATEQGTQLVPPETLLMVVRGMILARRFPVAITTAPVTFNQDIKALRPRKDIDPWFLLSWLQSMEHEVLRRVDIANHGTKRLPTERLFEMRLPLPSLAEQREIAATIASVDDAIAAGEAVADQVRRLRKSIHFESCSGRLDAGRPRRSGPWGEQPAEWRSASLGELVRAVRHPCTPVPGSMFIEIGVRSHGKGVFLKEAVEGSTLGSKRVFFVEPGCLVLNIVFAWEGAVAVTTDKHGGAIASHRFPMFSPVPGAADSRFLRHLLLTPSGLRLLGVASPGGAGRNRTLNQGMLLKTQLPCPALHEQQVIADTLDELDHRISVDEAVLQGRREVKAALADALFSSRLRVWNAA